MHRSIVACTLLLIGSLIFVVELAIAGPTTAPSTPSTQPVNKMCAVMREDKIDPKVPTVFVGHLHVAGAGLSHTCLLYTSPSPRDGLLSRMPSSA